jgi:hypothetical protein
METQREKIMGSEGDFLRVRLWEMKLLNILVLAIKKVVRYYGFP